MGHSHYWYQSVQMNAARFDEFRLFAVAALEQFPLKEPGRTIDDHHAFSIGGDCETMTIWRAVPPKYIRTLHEVHTQGGLARPDLFFNFCKTKNSPHYDFQVRLILLLASHMLNFTIPSGLDRSAFLVKSDATFDEWLDVFVALDVLLNRGVLDGDRLNSAWVTYDRHWCAEQADNPYLLLDGMTSDRQHEIDAGRRVP